MDLKEQFIKWAAQHADQSLLPSHPIIDACLEDAIREALNTTVNGIQFSLHYSYPEQMQQVLTRWQSNVFLILKVSGSIVNISLRGVFAPPVEDRQEMYNQFLRYSDQF